MTGPFLLLAGVFSGVFLLASYCIWADTRVYHYRTLKREHARLVALTDRMRLAALESHDEFAELVLEGFFNYDMAQEKVK